MIVAMETQFTGKLGEGEVVEELLEGGLKIIQNVKLYRFTSDSVLLTRFVKAKAHEKAADFCAGSGIVGLHFYALNPEKVESVALFEMQKDLSDMSRRSVALNGLKNFTAVNCRVQDIGKEYDEYFSLVLANPPYERGGFSNDDYKKAICRKEITVTLAEIVDAAFAKLKFGGRLALVNRATRGGSAFRHEIARHRAQASAIRARQRKRQTVSVARRGHQGREGGRGRSARSRQRQIKE